MRIFGCRSGLAPLTPCYSRVDCAKFWQWWREWPFPSARLTRGATKAAKSPLHARRITKPTLAAQKSDMPEAKGTAAAEMEVAATDRWPAAREEGQQEGNVQQEESWKASWCGDALSGAQCQNPLLHSCLWLPFPSQAGSGESRETPTSWMCHSRSMHLLQSTLVSIKWA